MKRDYLERWGGKVRFYKTLTTGERVFCGEYYNDITKAAKDAIISSIAQSGATTKLSGTFFAQKIAFCSGVAPKDPIRDALDAEDGVVVSYETLEPANPEISTNAAQVTVTFTATYTNSSAAGVKISFVAMVYGNSTDASNVFGVVVLTNPPYTPIDVGIGETLTTEYTMGYQYGTHSSPV